MQNAGISEQSQNIIINSWRNTTRKHYQTYIKQWLNFCNGKGNPLEPDITLVIHFLTSLYDKGLSYSAIGVARSAVSSFLNIVGGMNIGLHPLVCRFMKGVFNSRPALPRYSSILDVQIVRDVMKHDQSNTLLMLSRKLSMLFLLLSGQRCQTLHLVCVNDVTISSTAATIVTPHLLKTSKPGKHQSPFIFKRFSPDKNLCSVRTLEEYLERTQELRTSDKLLISTVKPHGPVSKQTIGRWIKETLRQAGISDRFVPHSTRAAATSKAKMCGVPLQSIIHPRME